MEIWSGLFLCVLWRAKGDRLLDLREEIERDCGVWKKGAYIAMDED